MTQLTNPPSTPQSSLKLMIIALGMGVLAVVVYNLHITYVKQARQEQTFLVYRLSRSVRPGDMLKQQDVRPVEVPSRFQDAFQGCVGENAMKTKINDRARFSRQGAAGALVTYEMLGERGGAGPLQPEPGMRFVSLPVNSKKMPGELLPGIYVDIEAPFNVGGSLPVVYPVMERVKVMTVGDLSISDQANPETTSGPVRSYRSITIQVTPDEATQLSMVEKMAVGEFELHLRNVDDQQYRKISGGGVNPAVLELIKQRIGRPLPAPGAR